MKVAKILHYSFRFLNKLKEIKEKKRLSKELAVISLLSASADVEPLNPALPD